MIRQVSASVALVLIFVATSILAPRATAQEEERIWEYNPYQVRVWLALDDSPLFPAQFASTIAQRVHWSSEQVDLSGWRVRTEEAPAKWRHVILDSVEDLELPEDEESQEELLVGDKLIFVAVECINAEYHITARELDCRTKVWGPTIRESSHHRNMLPHLVYQTISNAFVPLIRIDDVNTEQGTAVARVRAGGFHTSKSFGSDSEPVSPVWVTQNDVFIPMIRRTTRTGNTREAGIRMVDWTYLTVRSRDGVVLRCDIHSATRAPLGGRSSRRVEKLALVVRPQSTTTRLVLESRDDPPVRLSGYQILSKYPGQDEERILGKTDWQGAIEIERGTYPLQIVYVRSGTRPLARLPMVPGVTTEISAPMYNDDVRRRAEGIMRGLETEFMIVVAKRELLATRIRLLLAKDDVNSAEELFLELQALPSMDQFQSRVDSEERSLSTTDRREEIKIELMFNQLRNLVTKHLNRDVVGPLRDEIAVAKDRIANGLPATDPDATNDPDASNDPDAAGDQDSQ